MKFAIFALLLAIAFEANLIRKEPEQLYSSLAEIAKNPFGNTMLNLLSLNMKTKQASLQEIKELINEIRQSLYDGQGEQDIIIAGQRLSCDSIITSLVSDIDTAKKTITEAEDRIENNNQQIEMKTSLKLEAEANIRNNEKKIIDLDELNIKKTEYFNGEISNLNEAIATCDEAKNIVATFRVTEGSFIQLSSKLSSFSKLKNKLSSKYMPMIDTVVILAQKTSPETITKLTELINDLQIMLNVELNGVEQAFGTWKSDFERDMAKWNEEIVNWTNDVALLVFQIQSLNDDIARDTKLIEEQTALIEIKDAELTAERELCASQEAYYAAFTETINAELEVLARLDEHFAKKIEDKLLSNEYLTSQA